MVTPYSAIGVERRRIRGVIVTTFTMTSTFQEPPAHAELAAQVTEENSRDLLLRAHDPGRQLKTRGVMMQLSQDPSLTM